MSVITRPDHIERFRLVSVRSQLKLERLGMKNSRGAVRPRIAVEMGLKPRDSYDTYIAELTKRIDAIPV